MPLNLLDLGEKPEQKSMKSWEAPNLGHVLEKTQFPAFLCRENQSFPTLFLSCRSPLLLTHFTFATTGHQMCSGFPTPTSNSDTNRGVQELNSARDSIRINR